MMLHILHNPLLWMFLFLLTMRNFAEWNLSRRAALRSAHVRPGILSLVSFYFLYFGIAGAVLWTIIRTGGHFPTLVVAGVALIVLHGLRQWIVRKVLAESYHQLTEPLATGILKTTGPYAIVRHPVYAVYTLEMLALASMAPNVISYAFVALDILITLVRIAGEERLLLQHYGDSYRVYQKKTYRFIPFLW